MFENDYIMRLINEMVRALLRLIFHTDLDSLMLEVVKENDVKSTVQQLLDMIDQGEINAAENRLSDVIDSNDQESLKTALLFYSYLNEKNDDFLESRNYTREEIQSGLENTLEKFGLKDLSDAFFLES